MPLTIETLDTSEVWVYEPEHPSNGRTRVSRGMIGVFGGANTHYDNDGKLVLDYVCITMPKLTYEDIPGGNVVFSANVQPHPKSWKFIEYPAKNGQRYFHHPDYVLNDVAGTGWFVHKDEAKKADSPAQKKA